MSMWRLLLTRPGFRFLYLGDLVSMIGDWFTYVAVSVLALDQGHGLWAVAGVLLAHTLPKTLLSPAAGWLADRMDRRALLVWASMLRGLMVLGMLAAASAESLWGVQALLWARMGVGAFVDASAYAILPRVVAPHELATANALANSTWSLVFGAGVALGGFVTAWAGVTAALVVDVFTFFTAALIFWQIGPIHPTPETPAQTSQTSQTSPPTISPWTPSLLWTALGKAPASMANGVGWMMLHVAADLSLTETAALLGFFHMLRAVGTGIGPVWWAKSARLQKSAFSLSNLLTFAGVALFVVTPRQPRRHHHRFAPLGRRPRHQLGLRHHPPTSPRPRRHHGSPHVLGCCRLHPLSMYWRPPRRGLRRTLEPLNRRLARPRPQLFVLGHPRKGRVDPR
jgi:MFS family permease